METSSSPLKELNTLTGAESNEPSAIETDEGDSALFVSVDFGQRDCMVGGRNRRVVKASITL